jgi:branched-chain amino acid transport system permease protein
VLVPAVGVLFDGFAYGMLLFLLSVGYMTLGMMNFARTVACHARGCVNIMVQRPMALPRALPAPAAAAASVVPERTSRRLYRAPISTSVSDDRHRFCVAVAAYVYGTTSSWSIRPYPRARHWLGPASAYRCSSTALAITLVLVQALEYTRFGAQVRAAVDNQRMARGLGIDVDRRFAITFALGSGLAGLGGALAIEMVGLDPAFAFTYLVYVLIVVSVGGLGSIGGSFAAATLLGVSDVAGKYYVPELGAFLIYLVMVGLLMWRPAGLLGRR